MEPVKDAIATAFLPALFQEGETDNLAKLRQQLGLSVKNAGLGLPNPIDCASHNYEASKKVTACLTESLLTGKNLNTAMYSAGASHLR